MPPPKPQKYRANVTGKQFAEISDASISFQIPVGSSNDEFLLDSDPGEFLEDVAPTPGPSRLRLAFPMSESPGEVTPKSSRQISVSVPPREPQVKSATSLEPELTSFVTPQEAAPFDLSPEDATPRPTLRLTTSKASEMFPEASPVKDRLDAIRSSLNELGPEAAPGPPIANPISPGTAKPVKTNANAKRPSGPSKPTTISGGITKKTRTSSSKPLQRMGPRSRGSKSSNTCAQPFDTTPPFESTPRVTTFAPPTPPQISSEPALAAQPQSQASSNPLIGNAAPGLFLAQEDPFSSIIAHVSPKHANPLTVSQLSPSKQALTHREPASESPPAFHRRSLGKRPFSVTTSEDPDSQLHSQKRTKVSSTKPAAPGAEGTAPDNARHYLGTSLKPDSRTALRQTRGVARGRVVTESQLDRGKSLRRIASTNTKTSKLFSSAGGVSRSQRPEPERLSSSDGRLRSRPTRSTRADTRITAAQRSKTDQGKGVLIAQNVKSKTKATSVAEDDKENKRVTFPLSNATKPVEFTFRSEARLEARKSESEHAVEGSLTASKRRGVPSQIPDYKTLHAQDEARRSQRKAPAAPTIPHPFNLSTENRVRERQVFDDHVREKERELELVMEQKRREKEEEEEREIRELRKKAIPKAHVVPDWYKDAPKRTNKAREVGVAGSFAGPVA